MRNYLRSAAWDRGSGERSPRNYRLAQIISMLNEPASNISIKKIKSVKADPHDIHSDNYTEENAGDDLSKFFVFRGEELIVHHKEDAGQSEKKYGIVI